MLGKYLFGLLFLVPGLAAAAGPMPVMPNEPATAFTIDLDGGELTYAGARVARSEATVASKRPGGAADWMSRAFPRIKKKHVFRYASNAPDAFPAAAALQSQPCCAAQRA